MSGEPIISAFAVAAAVTAAVSDVRRRLIPNRLTYPSMIAGLVLQTCLFGWRGLLSALAGGLFFGGIFLLFYIVHAMGAGDVKLATALGCIVGVSSSVHLMFATAIAGGLLAITFAVRAKCLRTTFQNTLSVVGFHARHGLQSHPEVNLSNPKSVRMPYGLAFAAGSMFWAMSWLWWR